MAPNNIKKEEKYQFPHGPLPPGFIFKFSAFRHLNKGLNIRPSSAKLLDRNWDEKVRIYIKQRRIEEIIEPILISLLIGGNQDLNAKQFICEKLKYIQTHGLDAVSWKTFIPADVIPEKRSIAIKYLDEIDRIDGLDPCDEIYYIKAFNFRYRKLKRSLFDIWTRYVERKKENRRIKAEKMAKAKLHREKEMVKKIWTEWFVRCEEQRIRNHKASVILAKVYCLRFAKTYLLSWRKFTEEALKTRRYFEQIERGEIEDYNALMANKDADAIYRLPRAIAIKIFSYLNIEELCICRAVSREWNIITQSPSLWGKIDYSVCRHAVSDYAAIHHSKISRLYLSKLNLSKTALNLMSFKAFSLCRNVQNLNLSSCLYLTDEHVQVIVEGMPALLYLDLSQTNISDATLRTLGRTGLNIQYLRLAYCTKFSSKGLYYIGTGEGCRLLRFIDLSGCLQIPSSGFQSLANGVPHLKVIILNNLYSLEDGAMDYFLRKARGLEALTLKSAGGISNRGLEQLRTHTTLQRFTLTMNYKITDAILSSSLKFCHKLTDVTINDCIHIGDATMKAFSALRNIKRVNMSDCKNITDLGLRYLTDGQSGPNLLSLDISYLDKVTDMCLFRISQRCVKLQFLAVNYCERFTDSGFELLPTLPKLLQLQCRGCFISNHGASLIGKMKSIRVLNFSECQRIVDWEKAAKKLNPDLTKVNFSIIKSVNNTGIKHLAFNCRYLLSINISGCPDVTDLSLQYISGVCHYLDFIDISGLPHVSDRSVKYLRKGCKLLKHLRMLYMRSITKEGYEKALKWFDKVEWNQEDPPEWWQESYNRADKFLELIEGAPQMTFVQQRMQTLPQAFGLISKPKMKILTLRPKTAIGFHREKEIIEKPPPQKRKLQKRHTFDGVTINIHYNGPKGDNIGSKREISQRDHMTPRVAQIGRRDSQSSNRSRPNSVLSRPNTARYSRMSPPVVVARPISARLSKLEPSR